MDGVRVRIKKGGKKERGDETRQYTVCVGRQDPTRANTESHQTAVCGLCGLAVGLNTTCLCVIELLTQKVNEWPTLLWHREQGHDGQPRIYTIYIYIYGIYMVYSPPYIYIYIRW